MSRRSRLNHLPVLLAGLLLTASPSALADHDDEHDWTEPDGGLFGDAANWDPAAVPGVDDAAVFDLDDTFAVEFGQDHATDELKLRTGEVTFDLGGHTYTLTRQWGPNLLMTPGVDDTPPELHLRGGALEAWDSQVNQGRITVQGPDSAWISDLGLRLGSSGSAWLSATDGARVSADGASLATGEEFVTQALIEGEGSRLDTEQALVVGHRGTGELTIRDGGAVTSQTVELGREEGARGVLNILGEGSRLHVRDTLTVGERGDGAIRGTLTILPGASVRVGNMLMMHDDGTLNFHGGTLRFLHYGLMGSGPDINYTAGTVQLGGNRVLSNSSLIVDDFFNGAMTIPTGKGLHVEGLATLTETLTVDGGAFGVGELGNAHLLDFRTGTLNFIGEDGLTVGFDGPLGEELTLGGPGPFGEPGSPQHVNVSNQDGGSVETVATVAHEGVVEIHPGSSLGGERIENHGEIRLLGEGARLAGDRLEHGGGTLANHGLLAGAGRVSATLDNRASGVVHVADPPETDGPSLDGTETASDSPATPGRLVFTTDGNLNRGALHAGAGQTLEFLQGLTNEADGEVFLDQGASLRVGGGLTNRGGVTLHGDAEVHGDVTITADTSGEGEPNNAGRVSVVDDSRGTFFGDVTNEGLVQVGAGSHALFLGDVTGSGDFPGSGTVEFADTFSPGSSPGRVVFGGDVQLLAGTLLTMELAGLDISDPNAPEYDHLDIAGTLHADGVLDISLLDGFRPGEGDRFQLFDFASLEGEFDRIDLPTLAGGLEWETSELYHTGAVSVVPEPASLALLGLGVLSLLRRRRI